MVRSAVTIYIVYSARHPLGHLRQYNDIILSSYLTHVWTEGSDPGKEPCLLIRDLLLAPDFSLEISLSGCHIGRYF